MNKSLSVVIPCYNNEKYIGKAIKSVLDQNYYPIELIVVDDGSTDNSKSIILSFGEKITLIESANFGACNARNLGLAVAKYEYLIFLDSDDYFLDDCISNTLKVERNFDILFGNFIYECNGVKLDSMRNLNARTPLEMFKSWIEGNFIPPCSVIWRKQFLNEIGCWDKNVKKNQDGELVLRGLLFNPIIAFDKNNIGVYVQHNSLGRISKKGGREIIVGNIRIFDNLYFLASSKRALNDEIKQSFAKAWYSIAYEAYYQRNDDLGELAMNRAYQVGLRGHFGTKKHRFFATIFGLKLKIHLSLMLSI